jgi:hypothetical protein
MEVPAGSITWGRRVHAPLRPRQRRVAVFAVNLILLGLLLELAGVAVFYAEQRRLFYQRPRSAVPAPAYVDPAPVAQLHPVLGFANRPGLPVTEVATRARMDGLVGPGVTPPWAGLTANNFGFFAGHDYPYHPPDDAFVIGVLGGSTAQWFSMQGAATLLERLEQAPELAGRRVEVVNLAQGSFKQPQQLQILAHFLALGQPLDLVVNMDGFNEVALSWLNIEQGVDPSLPASTQLLPLIALAEAVRLPLAQVEAFARARRGQQQLAWLDARAAGAGSAGVWLGVELWRRYASRRASTAKATLADGFQSRGHDLVSVLPPPRLDGDDAFASISSVWMQASVVMHDMLRARGIRYLHVVQPNQYHSKRRFSEDEARGALNRDSPFREGARRGYPYLLGRIPALRSRAVDVLDAVEVFDAVSPPVYADDCCHYNQLGNEVLARFIGDHLVGVWSTSNSPEEPPS